VIKIAEQYEPPSVRRYSQFYAMSPAGCKLGLGVFPFKGLKFLQPASPPKAAGSQEKTA